MNIALPEIYLTDEGWYLACTKGADFSHYAITKEQLEKIVEMLQNTRSWSDTKLTPTEVLDCIGAIEKP